MSSDLASHLAASKRVLVLGCPGAGKTTFSRLAARFSGLPLIHLDDEHWGSHWHRPDEATWIARQERLVRRETWIIDGNYLPTVPIRSARADLAVVLDAPASVCVARTAIRAARIQAGDTSALPAAVRSGADGRPKATQDFGALLKKITRFRRRDFWRLLVAAGAGQASAPHVIVVVAGPGMLRRIRLLHRELARRGLAADVVDDRTARRLLARHQAASL